MVSPTREISSIHAGNDVPLHTHVKQKASVIPKDGRDWDPSLAVAGVTISEPLQLVNGAILLDNLVYDVHDRSQRLRTCTSMDSVLYTINIRNL